MDCHYVSRRVSLSRVARLVVASAALGLLLVPVAPAAAAVTTKIDISYSYQRYNNWCGSASVQMILSSPAVKNNNAIVADFLSAPDDPGRRPDQPRLLPTIVGNANGVGVVTRNPQAFIYGLNHGVNTVNGVSYFNPFVPYGSGSDTLGMAAALNLMDNPTFPGGLATGKHAYTAWNLPAGNVAQGVTQAALATKMMANSMSLTGVAAQAGIGGGTHSIVVNGVTTDVAPAANTNYKITGVIVSDPWTGFVDNVPGGAPPNTPRGFGFNAWVPSGYDLIPGAGNIFVPGVGVVQGRYKEWFKSFNVSPATPGAGPVFASSGIQFITATAGPGGVTVPVEVGGPGNNFFGIPAPAVPLANRIPNAAAARAQALIALGGNAALAGAFVGGNFADPAGIVFRPNPNPIDPLNLALDGDWLIPFIPDSGIDFTGALIIDGITGDIDLGIYSPDPALDYQLDDILDIYDDLTAGLFPSSGIVVPEPTTLGLFAPGLILLARRRDRK